MRATAVCIAVAVTATPLRCPLLLRLMCCLSLLRLIRRVPCHSITDTYVALVSSCESYTRRPVLQYRIILDRTNKWAKHMIRYNALCSSHTCIVKHPHAILTKLYVNAFRDVYIDSSACTYIGRVHLHIWRMHTYTCDTTTIILRMSCVYHRDVEVPPVRAPLGISLYVLISINMLLNKDISAYNEGPPE